MAAEFGRSATTCVVLWYEPGLLQHLRSTLEALLGAFGDQIEFVCVTDDAAELQHVAAQLDAQVTTIPLHQFCSGVASLARFMREE
jgi:hypothetical protein